MGVYQTMRNEQIKSNSIVFEDEINESDFFDPSNIEQELEECFWQAREEAQNRGFHRSINKEEFIKAFQTMPNVLMWSKSELIEVWIRRLMDLEHLCRACESFEIRPSSVIHAGKVVGW